MPLALQHSVPSPLPLAIDCLPGVDRHEGTKDRRPGRWQLALRIRACPRQVPRCISLQKVASALQAGSCDFLPRGN